MLEKLSQMGQDNLSDLEAAYKELLKAQERLVIKAAIAVQKAKMKIVAKTLKSRLSKLREAMKTFVRTTLVSVLKSGFKGKAADFAEAYLTKLKLPHFRNFSKEEE